MLSFLSRVLEGHCRRKELPFYILRSYTFVLQHECQTIPAICLECVLSAQTLYATGLLHTAEAYMALLTCPKPPQVCFPRFSWCCNPVNALDLLTQARCIPSLCSHWCPHSHTLCSPMCLANGCGSPMTLLCSEQLLPTCPECGWAPVQAIQWTSLLSTGLHLHLL